jgi:hypothetical protein
MCSRVRFFIGWIRSPRSFTEPQDGLPSFNYPHFCGETWQAGTPSPIRLLTRLLEQHQIALGVAPHGHRLRHVPQDSRSRSDLAGGHRLGAVGPPEELVEVLLFIAAIELSAADR